MLLADLTNNTSAVHEEETVKIIIVDENGNQIEDLYAIIGKLQPGQTKKLNAQITSDIVNAYDFKIEAAK